ncbi:glucan biosynthesis protein G [Pseudomonas sp. NPDC077649]|uniref:glucan biosynthesis protein G n=1 Tax=Pseudomonas sp. NPDC077649 TaxID=3364423 RepID=UPI0037C67042
MSRCSATRLGKAGKLALWAVPLLFAAHSWAFDLDDVAVKAKALAAEGYNAPQSNLPGALRELAFADYQKLRFREDQAHWRDGKTPFQLYFFHQGMHFDLPVKINEVTAKGVREIRYDPAMFDFADLPVQPGELENLGFAGFKVIHPLNAADKHDELMSVLGASYFRVVGKGQVYGLSARGLAIDTALPSGEEFPRFSEFWIEQPQADRRSLVIYALLDSPRATGAYRMEIKPGADSVLDVEAKLYLRDSVEKLGIAPLTSMYLFGANQPWPRPNYRPELHDSDGLAIHAGNGEWLWRPLNNPQRLNVSSYRIDNPRGFGLLQRGRDFAQYQDLDDRYELRPSAWVETLGDWGPGHVELVEIPTPDETNDNIVALWRPDTLPAVGQPLDIAYRLHFSRDEAALHDPQLAWVSQTRLSEGDVKQANLIRQPDGSTALLVDFVGPRLAKRKAEAPPTVQASVDGNAELLENSLRYNPVSRGWRLTLRVKIKDPAQPVEMRAALVEDGKPLSETWSYQLPAHE